MNAKLGDIDGFFQNIADYKTGNDKVSYLFNNVTLKLAKTDNSVSILRIEVPEMERNGVEAAKALDLVTKSADQFGVTLDFISSPDNGKTEALSRVSSRWGFVSIDPKSPEILVRQPQGPS